VNNIRCWI